MDSPRTVGNFEDDDDDQIIIEEVKHEADDDDCVEYLLEDHIEYLPNDDEDDDDDGGLIVEEIVVDHQPEVFHCNSCDTQFQSVEKHIQEFHADEDVHIEESDGIMLERNDEDDEEDVSFLFFVIFVINTFFNSSKCKIQIIILLAYF